MFPSDLASSCWVRVDGFARSRGQEAVGYLRQTVRDSARGGHGGIARALSAEDAPSRQSTRVTDGGSGTKHSVAAILSVFSKWLLQHL